MNYPNDLETMRKLFSCNSDDNEVIVLDESDTGEEKDISEKESDLDLEKRAESKFR